MPTPALCKQLNLSSEQIVSLADRHTLAVQAWLSSRAPQAARFEGQGVRASSTGIQVPLLNLALGADYIEGDEELIGREIEAVKHFFAGRDVPWYWWLGPTARPLDMGQRLERAGILFDRPPLPAMVTALPGKTVPIDPTVKVWQASQLADLQAASAIRHKGFRFPEGVALDYFESMPASWLDNQQVKLYLASTADGTPAAIGATIMAAGVPGVYVMATLPQYQRQGLGKAVLDRIMSDAVSAGHQLMVLTASRIGFLLYSQFGFEQVFEYAIYRLSNKLTA